MVAPRRRGPGALSLALLVVGLALIAWDGWRWWRSRHPFDDGSYAGRADWSETFGGASHFFGYAYRDRNRNGRQDPGEPPMAWVALEMTTPSGHRSVYRTNVAGFANIDMSRSSWWAPLHAPGEYHFRFLIPPGFEVTTGNAEQTGRVELLAGAPADLASAEPLAPIGLAPKLAISGRLMQRAADGSLLPATTAHLLATAPGSQAAREIPVDDQGSFHFDAATGTWRLAARSTAPSPPAALERTVEVRDAPVVALGLVLGEPTPPPAGRRILVTFDDITMALVSKIGFGWAVDGLSWGALHALRADEGSGEGYANVLSSGSYVAYSSIPVTLARDGGFDFYGGYFTVGHREGEGEILHLQAFRGDHLIADDDVRLSAMTPQWLDAGYLGIDRVVFTARHSWQFAADNLELSAREPVPQGKNSGN